MFVDKNLLSYSIPKASFVSIKIFDIFGREVENLVNEEKPAVNYKIEFDGSNFASGVYFNRMQAYDFISVRKFTLLK